MRKRRVVVRFYGMNTAKRVIKTETDKNRIEGSGQARLVYHYGEDRAVNDSLCA